MVNVQAGQCVQISEDEVGIVLEIATLLTGEQIYKVFRAFDDDEAASDRETTYVLTASPVAPGSRLCAECPLWYDGRCGLSA
ncbi:MAG: hypothetical protein E5V89_03805 [Mesorhizobium sp.]|nr:MAG: hypothetical protein E5V89_03805 [Mesorhizobium sp.]